MKNLFPLLSLVMIISLAASPTDGAVSAVCSGSLVEVEHQRTLYLINHSARTQIMFRLKKADGSEWAIKLPPRAYTIGKVDKESYVSGVYAEGGFAAEGEKRSSQGSILVQATFGIERKDTRNRLVKFLSGSRTRYSIMREVVSLEYDVLLPDLTGYQKITAS